MTEKMSRVDATPKQGALTLPERRQSVAYSQYAIPEEFLAADDTFFNLDTEPRVDFGGWSFGDPMEGVSNSVRTIISLGGLNSKPRHILQAMTHPWDYVTGKYERALLESTSPEEYAPWMDQGWIRAQTAVTVGVIGASTVFYGWNGSKTVDGAGRVPLWPHRNAVGKLKAGAYLQNLGTTTVLFLIGGSLAAEHRMLQDRDDMNAVSAYATAASPYGWYLALGSNEDYNFQDYMYGDTAGGVPGDILQPIVARAANINGVGTYAVLFPKDVQPFLQKAYEAHPEKFVAVKTPAEARRLAWQAVRQWGGEGNAIAQVEAARNGVLKIGAEEKAAVRALPAWKRPAAAVAMQYTQGRWKVMVPRYASKATFFWLYNAMNYHYVWGKSWKESFLSAASTFYTCALGEPWTQMLKTAYGVERIPFFVEVIPTMGALVTVQSVNVWDRDVYLKRCQSKRANLLHTLDPERRAKIRDDIAFLYAHANPSEREVWDKPIEEGGCGIVPEAK